MATALKSPTASGPTFWEIEERLMALADTEELVDPAHKAQYEADVEALRRNGADKVDAICAFIHEMGVRAATVDAEILRLQDRKRRFVANAERMESYLRRCLKAAGKKRVEGHYNTVALEDGKPSVDVVDADAVPLIHKRVTAEMSGLVYGLLPEDVRAAFSKTMLVVNKAEAMKLMKAGEEIPGLDLKFGQEALRIK